MKATEYLIDELKKIGFQPEYSCKKSVIVDLGGLRLNRTDSGLVDCFGGDRTDPAAHAKH